MRSFARTRLYVRRIRALLVGAPTDNNASPPRLPVMHNGRKAHEKSVADLARAHLLRRGCCKGKGRNVKEILKFF